MKRFFKGFLIVLLISAVSITAYSLFENRRISLGSLLPDDFTEVTALHIKKGSRIAAVGTLEQKQYDTVESYKGSLKFANVKKYDPDTDGHMSEEYYIVKLGDERLIIFDDDTVMVSKNGTFRKYFLVDHVHTLIGNRFVWR